MQEFKLKVLGFVGRLCRTCAWSGYKM